MNKNHTNESNYTKLVMPRQLVLPLDYGILIKETAPVRLLDAVLAENRDRLLSDTGIQLRINRSIQVEGTFGVLKQDLEFRRFLHRGSGNVHKMLYLLAMGFNIAKLHNRIQAGRVNTTLFTAKQTA
mgnify:FL=1